jgi:protein-L-isoaspartate(D-aspartate) O-methyltransferase
MKNILFSILLLALLPNCLLAADLEEERFTEARKAMVESQLWGRGIKDGNVLNAMNKVKRHEFVPLPYRAASYADRPLPIGEEQTISQPYIVALMTELLKLKNTDRVLEVGTGSGYQAAILAEIAKEVYTIEIVEPLATRSQQLLKELGYSNIKVKCGDGFVGWKEYAPFDAIIVTCAPKEVPQPLIDQLAEGGRLVIPVGVSWQELKLIKKEGGKINSSSIIPVRFVPMTGELAKKQKTAT